jgi:hypothetical protein
MIPIYYITESTLKSVWSEDRESYYIQEIIHGSHSLYPVLTWVTLFSQIFYPGR